MTSDPMVAQARASSTCPTCGVTKLEALFSWVCVDGNLKEKCLELVGGDPRGGGRTLTLEAKHFLTQLMRAKAMRPPLARRLRLGSLLSCAQLR